MDILIVTFKLSPIYFNYCEVFKVFHSTKLYQELIVDCVGIKQIKKAHTKGIDPCLSLKMIIVCIRKVPFNPSSAWGNI